MTDEPKLYTSTHGGSVIAYGHWGPGFGTFEIPRDTRRPGFIYMQSQPKNNHAGDKTMIDERHIIYEIDRCTTTDELIRFQRGLNADGDMTPKIERLIAARLAYLDVFDAVRR